jgi:toxin YoeB
LSPKRRNKPDKAKKNHIYGYLPVFSPDFKKDLAWWYRNQPKKGSKGFRLQKIYIIDKTRQIPQS